MVLARDQATAANPPAAVAELGGDGDRLVPEHRDPTRDHAVSLPVGTFRSSTIVPSG